VALVEKVIQMWDRYNPYRQTHHKQKGLVYVCNANYETLGCWSFTSVEQCHNIFYNFD